MRVHLVRHRLRRVLVSALIVEFVVMAVPPPQHDDWEGRDKLALRIELLLQVLEEQEQHRSLPL